MKPKREPPRIEHSPTLDLQRCVRLLLRQSRQTALVSSAAALILTANHVRAQESSNAKDVGQEPVLSEIVVSAQRRTQSLQDVPYNISAINGDTLQDAGVVSINSLTQVVPGLLNVDEGAANRGDNNNFVLRGLRTNPPGGGVAGAIYHNLTVSPVSTYFGDTPVFFQMPLDDLERVEVLRGPQGTLYGSGAEAGTIRFIPKRPEFDSLSGEVNADGSYTQYSPNANGSAHGILNIPLADHLALRVVAGEDHIGGFITAVNHVQTGAGGVPVPSIPGNLTSGFVLDPEQRGVNRSDQWFARAALRWQPISAVDVQLDYLHQHTSVADSQWGSAYAGGPFDSSFGAYPTTAVVDTRAGCNFCSTGFGTEPYSSSLDLLDVNATIDVGLGTVTSSTSYFDEHSITNFDQTGQFYGTANPPSPQSNYIPYYPYNNYPRVVAGMRSPALEHTLTQELRLVSDPGRYVDYVVGLYYQREDDANHLVQALPGITAYDNYIGEPSPTLQGDNNYLNDRTTMFSDKAIFGELTYHVTPAWQVTAGVRFFWQTFTNNSIVQLPLCGAPCSTDQINPNGLVAVTQSLPDHDHVKKFNTSYDISSTLKVYATYSEGFRHGGVAGLSTNGPFASAADLQTFSPDYAKNYEVGMKGSLFEHRINYFADVYMVSLKNFQFDNLSLGGFVGAFNGRLARSQGLEFESQAAVTEHLNLGIGYAFTRAYVPYSFNILDYPPYALPAFGGNGQLASLFGGPIAAGTNLPGVSRHVANLSGDYTLPTGALTSLVFHLDGSYRSAQSSNLNPNSIYTFTIPSVFLANARVSFNSVDNLTYSFFIRNITNNPDITGGANDQEFENPYRLRNVGTPRTYGLGIRYQFGKR